MMTIRDQRRALRQAFVVVVLGMLLSSPAVGQPRTGVQDGGRVVGAPAGQRPPTLPPRDRSGRPQEPVKGTATISGRVVAADSGQPLRRASVTAFPMSPGPGPAARPLATRTDEDGSYVLRELPAGVYTVSVQRAGYTQQAFGQTSPNMPPRRITVEDGSKVSSIDFQLQRGGVITGRVTDDAGEPAEGIVVRVVRAQRMRGRVRYVPAAGRHVVTDDLGQYRLYGLPPGEYLVVAEPGAGGAARAPATQESDRLGTVTTYAPGTPAPGDAQRYLLAAGQEIPVDVQLMAGRLVTIAGRVLDSSGKSLEGGMISLVPQDTDVVMVGITGRGIQPDGSFVVPGVTPGAYTMTVMASGRRPMAGPDEAAEVESASVSIVVSDEDVEGLVITTSPPSTIAGRLIVEGDEAALRGVQLRMFSRPPGDMPMTMGVRGTGSVDENFSVRMSGLRGEQVLSLTGLPRGWWVKSIRIGGQNALRGFDFGTGRKLTGLEIVVNNRPASIGGQVTRPDGQPASDYMVFVFPEDLDNYHGPRIQGTGGTALPDQDGTYVVEGLRPGRYYAIAVERGQLEMSGMDDPDALRALSQKAQAVEIAEGEQQYLSLRLVTP